MASNARYFHRATAEFVDGDGGGKPATTRTPIIVGNPEEAYVMVYPEIGHALRRAHSLLQTSSAPTKVEDRCKVTFFHDSQHFGFESLSYPRLRIPRDLPRQTDSETSPATLFLSGKMHEIVLDGTSDAQFAEMAGHSGRDLERALDQLKDM